MKIFRFRCSKPISHLILTTFIAILVSFYANIASATTLGDLAASMQTGEWRELPAVFPDGDFALHHAPTIPDHSIFTFTNSGVWDPLSRKMIFIGGGHCAGDCQSQMIVYDEMSNVWTTTVDLPGHVATQGHSYDHTAIDAQGNILSPVYYNTNVYKYDISTDAWTSLPALPYIAATKATAYFPERGALIVVDTENSAIYELQDGASSWSTLVDAIYYANYSAVAIYDHVRGVVYYGGGSNNNRAFFELDQNGRATIFTVTAAFCSR